MRQAIHIFRKDLRFLRYEVSLIVAFTLSFVWSATRGPKLPDSTDMIELLLLATTNFLIARLIHAEVIPGDRQFWVTRPYQWKSLLAAKLAFILIFVHFPVLVAHVWILAASGFPILPTIPGLLWTQFLIATLISLPVAALAAVTAGTVQFVLGALVVVALMSAVTQRVIPVSIPFFTFGPVDWVRTSIMVLMLLAICIPILYWQYKRRQTRLSRGFMMSGLAIAAATYLALPWTFAFGVQSKLSEGPLIGAKLDATFAPSGRQGYRRVELPEVEIVFPLSVNGIPANIDLRADAMSITLTNAAGRRWDWTFYELPSSTTVADGRKTVAFQRVQTVSKSTYEALRQGPVDARIALFLTAFGNPRTQTIPLQEQPVNVLDGLQCFSGAANREGDILCRSAFRWPSRIVDARVSGKGASTFTQFISYSPFPANLKLNPLEYRWASAYTSREAPQTREVTITLTEPLAYERRDFSFQAIEIKDAGLRPLTRQHN